LARGGGENTGERGRQFTEIRVTVHWHQVAGPSTAS
jgi:hypothetical protein